MRSPFLSSIAARRGHFRYESGHHSDFWMDLETLCARPTAILPFASELAARLRRYDVAVVCGPMNEGALVALMVAAALDCQFTYAERFVAGDSGGLYPVAYRLPPPSHAIVDGKRVAIVNDVISAGSAVRGTLADLDTCGARVVAVAALLVVGESFDAFARSRDIAVETLAREPGNLWTPTDCPLCRDGVPLEDASA
jgi:orotate phosphoribosyltransferase